jgi:hypothetical protein
MPDGHLPRTPIRPDDVVAAARVAEAALGPVAGLDWSVRAGRVEWDVEETVAHMIGAVAKYTLYLASRSERFIGLTVAGWPGATNQEIVDSLVPVATGLANVAAATPADVRAFHASGPSSAADYVGRGCVELLVHTDDALAGLGVTGYAPPADLCRSVLAQQFPYTVAAAPDPGRDADPWHQLLAATGRLPR